MAPAVVLAALIGVFHVHHEPSHDSDASFAQVLAAARAADLDFLVLTEHAADEITSGPLPAIDHSGIHEGEGGPILVLVGVEYGTADGHLIALGVPELIPAFGRPGAEVIADVHGQGGFAVVPHSESHGGWADWDAPFDGLEVHNNATELRRARWRLPMILARALVDWDSAMRLLLRRPTVELERWDALLARGRRVVAFSGADAHQNFSPLGWQLDPYERIFRAVQMVCPDVELELDPVWQVLREGRCFIRYSLFADRESETTDVRFESGRTERQLDDGARVYELHPPPAE